MEYGISNKVLSCYNSGNINGSIVMGLGAGDYVDNSYNIGEIKGKKSAAGIGEASISRCLNKGNIISTEGIAYGIGASNIFRKPWGAISTGKIQGKTGVYGVCNGGSSDENAEAYYLAGQLYLNDTKQADTTEAKTQEQIDIIIEDTPTELDILNSASIHPRYEDYYYWNKGNAFVSDTNNINNGYPVLKWQK